MFKRSVKANVPTVGILLSLTVVAVAVAYSLAEPQPQELPKYGPAAVRLYHERGHLQQNPAPDFWALMPYYRAQPTNAACSLAAATMALNALRAPHSLASNQQLITPANLLETLQDSNYHKAVATDGDGVTLDQLGEILQTAAAGLKLDNVTVEVVHVTDTPDMRDQLHQALEENERSDRDVLLVNFLQSDFTGDPEGVIGHFAPVAAYDIHKQRVLIFDPDRDWYEPYWVREETLIKAMATSDSETGKPRGYLWIRQK